MDQKQDYKEKYEKGKLHIRYLLIIASILAVIGISIAIGGNDEALGQISMASTVSSIILSSIAIFMSISGENKLNYTHDKLVETSDRMSGITANLELANNLLNDTINHITKIDYISERLEHIGQSVDNVEKEVFNRTTLRVNENSTVSVSSDIIWQVYQNLIEESTDAFREIIKAAIEYVVVYFVDENDYTIDDMLKYVESVVGFSNKIYEGYVVGVLGVFAIMGIDEKNNYKYFEERMELSQEVRDKIRKFNYNTPHGVVVGDLDK